MAVYRHIHINYWQDAFVLDLTPEEKYFYIYLMTNSKTSQCGVYELPKRIIETETGYNRETVDKLLKRFEEYKKIYYSNETNEIYIKNWMKHNKARSPKVKTCIEKELLKVKNEEFIEMFIDNCNKNNYSIDTSGIALKNKDISFYSNDEKYNHKDSSLNEIINKPNKEENNIAKYKILYEQNVGLINSIVGQWLIDISENVEYDLFKRAVEIATDKGKLNKGYINGIIKQWRDNNIKSLSDLKAYEVTLKNRGGINDGNKYEYAKPKYARAFEEEDEELYRKPTSEEIAAVEKQFNDFRN